MKTYKSDNCSVVLYLDLIQCFITAYSMCISDTHVLVVMKGIPMLNSFPWHHTSGIKAPDHNVTLPPDYWSR